MTAVQSLVYGGLALACVLTVRFGSPRASRLVSNWLCDLRESLPISVVKQCADGNCSAPFLLICSQICLLHRALFNHRENSNCN